MIRNLTTHFNLAAQNHNPYCPATLLEHHGAHEKIKMSAVCLDKKEIGCKAPKDGLQISITEILKYTQLAQMVRTLVTPQVFSSQTC